MRSVITAVQDGRVCAAWIRSPVCRWDMGRKIFFSAAAIIAGALFASVSSPARFAPGKGVRHEMTPDIRSDPPTLGALTRYTSMAIQQCMARRTALPLPPRDIPFYS